MRVSLARLARRPLADIEFLDGGRLVGEGLENLGLLAERQIRREVVHRPVVELEGLEVRREACGDASAVEGGTEGLCRHAGTFVMHRGVDLGRSVELLAELPRARVQTAPPALRQGSVQ